MPRISVIIPTYNRDYIIEKSIQSVLDQTYTDFELIVVDDGSTDGTSSIVENIIKKDDRVKLVHTPGNLGAAGARNCGIEHAVGELIAFEDSDDFWTVDKLEKCVAALDAAGEEYGFAYHKIRYDMSAVVAEQMNTDVASKDIEAYVVLPDDSIPDDKKSGDIYAQCLYDNLVACPALVVRKKLLDEIGGFDTTLTALEDYDLALRIAKNAKAVFVPEIMLNATYSEGSVSRNTVNYLTSSCMLIAKYKSDYLATNTLNHRLEIILRDSERIGMQAQYVELLEKIMQM